jgi:VWFA-related protein
MIDRRSVALAAALAAASVASPGAQQAPAPPPSQPVFRSGVETLSLDVTVLDAQGDPVRDLIAGDFSVRFDGRPRRVLSAQWVPAAGTGAGAAAAPALPDGYVSNEQSAGGRLIVLVIDQPNIPFGEMRPMRDAVEAFIDRMAPADRVAIVGFGIGAKSTSFLSNHDQLKKALALLPGQQERSSTVHDMGHVAAMAIDRGDEIMLSQVVSRDCQGTRRQIDLCRNDIQAEAAQVASDARQESELTLRSLRDVLTNLKAVDAPKTLMLVSQGFLTDPRSDDVTRITDLGALAAAARTSIYAFRLSDNVNDITHSKVTLSPALTAEDRRERRNGLETLTAAARGAMFDLVGTGAGVFERVSRELSGYYLLGVEPDSRDQDGKSHPIRVDVARSGLTIRAHRAMMAGGENGQPAARTPRDVVTAALSSPLPAASLPLRAIAFAFRGLDAGKLRLLVHADIGSAYTEPQRLAVGYYVVDRDGRTLDGQVSEVRLAPAAAGVPSPVSFSGGASVDPGDYTVKIAVADGDRIGSVDLPVHASLLDLGKVQLTELIAGGPVPPVNLLRPSVGTRVSFGNVHGYLEAYGPGAATLGVRFEVAAEERGPAILSADVQGQTVGDERVIFSHMMIVQSLPPGPYRLRAIINQGNALLTTLGRAFEVDGGTAAGAPVAAAAGTANAPATAPTAPLYLPVEQTEFARPFNRDEALAPATLQLFEGRVPPSAKAAFDEGVEHLRKREYKDAEATFKRAVQPDAESSSALVYLAVTYASAGRDSQAASVWRTSMAGADDVPQVYAWLGDALMRIKSLGEARPVIEEASERWPMDPRFARSLAMIYATLGKGVDAVKLLDRSLRDNPADQQGLFKCVEWIFNTHRAGFVVNDRAEDRRIAHAYADRYLKSGGLNEPLIKQWLGFLDKEAP